MARLHVERLELRRHAERVTEERMGVAMEMMRAIGEVENDRLAPCSDRELALMRTLVFRSEHLRDLGRFRNRAFNCGASVGRVATPQPMDAPDLAMLGYEFWTSTPLLISNDTHGFVVARDGISAVFNPDILSTFEERPTRSSTVYLMDRARGTFGRVFGPELPVTFHDLVSSAPIDRKGLLLEKFCEPKGVICSVTSERRSAVLKRGTPLLVAWTVGGAALGCLLVSILMMFQLRRRSMESQLRRAIAKRRFTLVYQPVMDLDSGSMVGVETLIRWKNEQGEAVNPEVFIALAESKGLVTGITRFVVSQSIAELCDILIEGRLRLNINVTERDLVDPRFLPYLEAVVRRWSVPRSSIGLELTERSTADHAVAIEALSQLKEAGYILYIDDFGTGFSSLSYLHRLSVHSIKIDRSFTQTIGTQSVTASVVPQILEMARTLDLQVVVEGIETAEQAAYLRQAQHGLQGQGWLYSRPVPLAELRTLVAAMLPEATGPYAFIAS